MMQKLFFIFIFVFFSVQSQGQVRDTIIKSTIAQGFVLENYPDSLFVVLWNDTLDSWEYNERYIFDYSANKKIILEEKSEWTDYGWLLNDKKVYSYSNEKLSSITTSWWDLYYEEWINESLRHYKYDSINRLQESKKMHWSESSLTWVNDSLESYYYTASGLLSSVYFDLWSLQFSSWEKNNMASYIYDTNANISEIARFFWDYDLLIWEPMQKNSFTYNAMHLLTEEVHYATDQVYNWRKDWKKTYDYYANDSMKEEVYFVWFDNAYWLEDYKFTYTYNDDGRISEKVGYIYDWDLLVWENHFKIVYNYLDDQYVKSITYFTWNAQSFAWNKLEKHAYYYPGFTSVLAVESNSSLNIYPNPVHETLYIQLNENMNEDVSILLIDLSGKILYTKEIRLQKDRIGIQLPAVSNGIYLLKIATPHTIFSEKIFVNGIME